MSLDARISAVTRILSGDCVTCGNSGIDPESGWDYCTECQGASIGKSVVRLHLEPREPGGLAGQDVLTVINPPEGDLSGLVGTEIWGGSGCIMVGDTKWAKRIGYTKIELVEN